MKARVKIINEKKKEIMSKYSDDFVLGYKKVAASGYYFVENTVNDEIHKYLLMNKSEVSDDLIINDEKSEFLSSNFKIKLFYGKDKCLVNSEYYLIINKEREFETSSNKVYIDDVARAFYLLGEEN